MVCQRESVELLFLVSSELTCSDAMRFSAKRTEIEGFLALYVQGLVALPSSSVDSTTRSAVPPLSISPTPRSMSKFSVPSVPSVPARLPSPLSGPTLSHGSPLPVLASPVLSAPSTAQSSTAEFKAPHRTSKSKSRRLVSDKSHLAAPSNSGIEPPSFTGTGSGMRMKNLPKLKRSISVSTVSKTKRENLRADDSVQEKVGKEIVLVLEKLFSDSLYTDHSSRDDFGVMSRGTSSEAYLGQLLTREDTDGWTYLRLACTFGQLHRYSVTLDFIQEAVREHSTTLQLNSGGSMIRWIGTRPEVSKAESSRSHHRSSHGASQRLGPPSESAESILSQPSFAASVLADTSTACTSVNPAKSATTTIPLRHRQASSTSMQPPRDSIIHHEASPSLHQHQQHHHITALEAVRLIAPLPTPRISHSSYVPFFERKHGSRSSLDSVSESRSGATGPLQSPRDDNTTSNETGNKRSKTRHGATQYSAASSAPLTDGEGAGLRLGDMGTMVFYANQPFCRDLSKDLAAAKLCQDGAASSRLSLLTSMELPGPTAESNPEAEAGEDEGDDSIDAADFDDADFKMQIFDDDSYPPTASSLSPSRHFASAPARVSGMNEVVASDLFTLTVQTLHYRANTSTQSTTSSIPRLSGSRKRNLPAHAHSETGSSNSHSHKRKKMVPFGHRVIHSKLHNHHVHAVERRIARSGYDLGTSSEDGSVSSRGSKRRNKAIPEIVSFASAIGSARRTLTVGVRHHYRPDRITPSKLNLRPIISHRYRCPFILGHLSKRALPSWAERARLADPAAQYVHISTMMKRTTIVGRM